MKIFFLAFALFLSAKVSLAAPKDLENYATASGMVDIPDGSYVEGSHRFGGIQPDYVVDYSHPEIQRLIAFAQQAAKEEPEFWNRIEKISNFIKKEQLPGRDYEDRGYRSLNKKYVKAGEDVPLGAYGACRAGVCRENALYLHIGLKAAGIENYHAYGQINRSSKKIDFDIVEDHAFTVVKHEGELWVADSYYRGFHGYRLKDLMSKKGITPESETSPFAKPLEDFRRIMKINSFPTVWVPKAAAPAPVLKVSGFFRPPRYQKCENYYRDFGDVR